VRTLLLPCSGLAAAGQFGVQVAGGVGDHHVKKLDLGLVWDPNLTWWQIDDWHFALIGQAHVAWWHTNEGMCMRTSAQSVWRLSFA